MPRLKNLTSRVLVAAAAIPVILWVAMLGNYFFFILVALISSFALYEFYMLAEAKGIRPLKTFGLIIGIIINAAFIYERFQVDIFNFLAEQTGIHLPLLSEHQFLAVVLIKFILFTMLFELFRTKSNPTMNIAVTISGVLIISLCAGTLIGLRQIFPYGFPLYKFCGAGSIDEAMIAQVDSWGGYTVIAVLAAIWICDTAAYFSGTAFGKHKLFERISPKKTWEGAVSGFVFSVLTMTAAKIFFIQYLSYQHAIVIGVLIGTFGQIGDLVESRFKRDAGVKDSSSIIPGHGGVYDRFDSLIYVSPIVYLYINFAVL